MCFILYSYRYVEHSSPCILYPYKLTFGVLISTSVVSETHIFSLFRILSGNFTHKHMYGWSMYLYRSASGFQLSFNLHATLLVHMSFTKINLVFRYNMMYYIKNWSHGSLNCEFFIDFVDLNIHTCSKPICGSV